MNLEKKLSSKSFLIFNLVLIGVIFGFSLAFLSFSCSTPGSGNVARAQAVPVNIEIPENALAIAEGLQLTFNAVADMVLPSVVEVKTVSLQRRQSTNDPFEFFFGPRGDSPEREYRSRAMGSGVIIRYGNGMYYVLTNNHVIDRADEIIVATMDGKDYPAEVVGRDVRRDLAVLSFTTNDRLTLAVLGDSDNVKVGDWAIAMGNPLGEQFAFSVTLGIVSAVGRTGGPGGNINDFIQTDASINQGNSGGPLVNLRGEVIGINTWIASNTGGGSVGLGFAIPINNAVRVIEDLIQSGSVRDGWLGVSLYDPNRDMLDALSITNPRGALAAQVFIGSPAYRSGIRPGDFITHMNDAEIRGSSHLVQAIGNLRPGEQVTFRVLRDGVSMTFNARIEARTDEVTTDNSNLIPGMLVLPMSDDIRRSLNLGSNAEGLFVSQVLENTPAAIVGLRNGDRITGINGIPVPNLSAFYRVLRENTATEIWFSFIRGENTLESIRYIR